MFIFCRPSSNLTEMLRPGDESEYLDPDAIVRAARALFSRDRVVALLRALSSETGVTSLEAWPAGMTNRARDQHLRKIRPLLEVLPGVGRSPSRYSPGPRAQDVAALLRLLAELGAELEDEAE